MKWNSLSNNYANGSLYFHLTARIRHDAHSSWCAKPAIISKNRWFSHASQLPKSNQSMHSRGAHPARATLPIRTKQWLQLSSRMYDRPPPIIDKRKKAPNYGPSAKRLHDLVKVSTGAPTYAFWLTFAHQRPNQPRVAATSNLISASGASGSLKICRWLQKTEMNGWNVSLLTRWRQCAVW